MNTHETHAILYDRAISRAVDGGGLAPEVVTKQLARHERLIVSPNVYHEIGQILGPRAAKELWPRCCLYFDLWGHADFRTGEQAWPVWQPGPGDLGQPPIRTRRGVYCYVMDDAHLRRFLLDWLWPAVRARACRGVFLDDFSFDRGWWELGADEKDVVWGPADGHDGWRAGADWNRVRMQRLELAALAMVGQGYAGVVCNGPGRQQGARLFEAFGQWVTPDQVAASCEPGDMIQVNGLLQAGAWATVSADEARYGGFAAGTSFVDVYRAACELAREHDLTIGVAFHHRDDASIYTHIGLRTEQADAAAS